MTGLSVPEDKANSSAVSIARDPVILYNSTKSDVDKRIMTLVDDDSSASLHSKAASKLYLTTNAFKDWKSDRRSGTMNKAGKGLQHVLCTIHDFLQSFSGIAEMIKSADQQYGGLAYGTVSLLLSVAVHKQRREEAIEEALDELAYAFPRLGTLQRIRPKDSVRSLIVEVFELVIVFCRETIEYFTQRFRRLTKALNPKELKFKTLSRLRAKLSEIHRECEIMMLAELADTRKQLHDVRTQLRQIQTTGNDTNIRVRDGQTWMQNLNTQAEETYFSELKQLLGLKRPEDATSSDTVDRYKSVLAATFSDHRRKRKIPRQMSWTLLKEDRTFSNWLEYTGSAMLLIGGSNWLDDSSIQLNWLSNASVLVVNELTTQSAYVFFLFCQTDHAVPRRKRLHFSDVVHNLIYQFTRQLPSNLRPQHQDIIEALQSPNLEGKDFTVAFDAMAQLLIKLMASFPEATEITVVIDRLDQCRWAEDSDIGANDLNKAVASLLDFVRDPSLAHIRIKVLLVMDDGPAHEIVKTMRWAQSRGLDWKVDWDQEADEDQVD